ncbi:MAG TPA: class I SAM-dependent methyltransferase [Phycisphaerae bacterium]|nr:class I SAM-dependent methyltransferase [Phycisphaerae bacterium]
MKDVISKFSEHALLNEMNERATKGMWEWESRVVEKHFPRKGSVLNIGCGCGREAIALVKMGYKVFAVDVAAKQIAIAKDNARREQVQITFAVSDGVSFPVGEALFDVIVLWSQVLGNMASRTEQLRLLESCRDSLGPDGLVSASVHERDFCRRDTPQCTDENWLYPWGRGQLRYQLFTRDSLDSLFKEAGLRTVVTEVPTSLRAIIYTVARRADDSQPPRVGEAEKPRG